MPKAEASGLKTITLRVVGTQYDRRYDVIRTLEPGTQVSLSHVKDNPHDSEAVSVILRGKQIGWIPREAATAVRGLKKRFAKVTYTGTDRHGRWTWLEISISFKVDSPAAKLIADHGPVVASVLYLMSPKDVEQATRIARLPKDEQKFAIEEWNMVSQDRKERRRS